MYKPEEPIGDVSYFEDHLKAMGKMTVDEKWNAIILGLLLLYTCTVTWTGLDLNLGFALVPFLLYLPFVKGATEKTIDKTNLQSYSLWQAAWQLVQWQLILALVISSLIFA